MGRRKKWPSAYLNNTTYIDFYNQLKELALNVFKYENLPDSIDKRFIELYLFEKGYILYFNDPIIGDLCLPCTIGGPLDVYNYPINRKAYASNGYQAYRSNKDSVLIYNNYLHTPTELTIRLYALRLYEIQRAIDVNVKGQKTPKMILSSEGQRLTMKNLYMQYDGNEPFIFGDKNLDLSTINVMDTSSPYVADKLITLKHQIWNEALTFLGIENSNQDKKERLVADEVASNYGNVEAQRNVMLNSRQDAIEKINKMFDQNIKVSFNSGLRTLVNNANLDFDLEEEIEPETDGDIDE